MEHIGTFVIYGIMGFALIGALAAIRDDQRGLGKEFVEGIHSIGPIFLPVAGIMASIPYLSSFVLAVFGPLFESVNAHPAMAASTFIAVDMGAYHLTSELATGEPESWIQASVVGYMAGATIVFSIPVGLAMIPKRDHKFLALGVMAGILSIPVGVLTTCVLLTLSETRIREEIATTGDATYALQMEISTMLANLAPLVIFCVTLALLLKIRPGLMIRAFLVFGRLMYAAVTIVLALSIVEHFTKNAFGDESRGLLSAAFESVGASWGFDPIVADKVELVRALEVAGFIGMMLAGAFPMVYVLQRSLARPIESLGKKLGLEPEGAAGILAASANILAMFRLVDRMRPKDKVLNIAFAVCAAFLFGDHLAFTANFQPTLILPLVVGKLAGGITGFALACWLSVPAAERLAAEPLGETR